LIRWPKLPSWATSSAPCRGRRVGVILSGGNFNLDELPR